MIDEKCETPAEDDDDREALATVHELETLRRECAVYERSLDILVTIGAIRPAVRDAAEDLAREVVPPIRPRKKKKKKKKKPLHPIHQRVAED